MFIRWVSIAAIFVAVLLTGCEFLPDIDEVSRGAPVPFAAQHPLAFSMLNVPGAPNAALVPTQEDWESYPRITHSAPRPVPYPDSLALVADHGPLSCTHDGGAFRQLVLRGDTLRVYFEPLVRKQGAVCTAGFPLSYVAVVAAADVPPEVTVVYMPPQEL